jgi:hypothetical protein
MEASGTAIDHQAPLLVCGGAGLVVVIIMLEGRGTLTLLDPIPLLVCGGTGLVVVIIMLEGRGTLTLLDPIPNTVGTLNRAQLGT